MEHKFNIGDKVRYKNTDLWGVLTITSIYQGCYEFDRIKPLTVSYVDDNFELVGDRPVLKSTIDLSADNSWMQTYFRIMSEITEQNTQIFKHLIDDTYRCFADSEDYPMDVKIGIMTFVNELKARLGIND